MLYVVHCFGRNKKVYEPPRYMTAAEAAQQLMTIVANRRASGSSDFGNPCSVLSLCATYHFACSFSGSFSSTSGSVWNCRAPL